MIRLRRLLLALAVALLATPAPGAERLHFLIPAGPGGGLDSTARALGNALQSAGLRSPISYENMTGGGGGRAMAHFVETAERQSHTLLVNSTPLVVRSLQGLFPHSHRDLVPVAGLVAEYGAFVVSAESELGSWAAFADSLRARPEGLNIGGGSVRGSLDHIVLALSVRAAGIDPRRVRYLPYDAGGKAMLSLLGGEIHVLSTGVGETLAYVASGDVRVLAVTAPERLPQLPEVPTLKELGLDVVFANWRGVFAAPGTAPEAVAAFRGEVASVLGSASWQASLARYAWSPLSLSGEDFGAYLSAQEAELGTLLTDLGFIRR